MGLVFLSLASLTILPILYKNLFLKSFAPTLGFNISNKFKHFFTLSTNNRGHSLACDSSVLLSRQSSKIVCACIHTYFFRPRSKSEDISSILIGSFAVFSASALCLIESNNDSGLISARVNLIPPFASIPFPFKNPIFWFTTDLISSKLSLSSESILYIGSERSFCKFNKKPILGNCIFCFVYSAIPLTLCSISFRLLLLNSILNSSVLITCFTI